MKRFARFHRQTIELAPLQAYLSALIFAPTRSIVRNQFQDRALRWIRRLPDVQTDWNSVLQTLAMIQRAPGSEEMTTLARAQERELRSWLYGRAPTGDADFRESLDAMAARIEQGHRVAIETVVVGDAPVDERARALIDAVGEAATNAAKHSGVRTISIYAEVAGDAIDVYVRDEGKGFDVGEHAPDRRGIAESILGRMERNGGTTTISSSPAEGTEVHLRLPRRSA